MYGILRPEARPRSIKDLTRSQLDAAERILATLKFAIGELRANKHRDSSTATRKSRASGSDSPDLDETRASRIFFLSGEAGTGKTTVYLSLRAVLETGAAEIQARLLAKEIRQLGEQKSQLAKKLQRADDLVDRAKKKCSRVVWLEPLTIETIASTQTNYLAAVLARFDRVLTDELGRPSEKERSSSLFDRDEPSDVLNRFQHLRTDIGLAWHGNLPKRGEHLDPDVYAEEMMRAEDARIHINKRLHDVLEDLTRDLYSRGKDPIFVLPIDDLSLNPGPSLEILRLLRLISVPRLFILAMGDTDGFEELGFQKHLGELVALAGHDTLGVERQQRVLMARARNMAFDAQRKLLPPAQRFRLEVLFWDEALNLRLSQADEEVSAPENDSKTLLQRLEEWKLEKLDFGQEATKVPNDFLKFLGKPGESRISFPEEPGPAKGGNDRIGKVEGIEDAYTGMQILEIPYRSALDLWLQVAHQLSTQNHLDQSEVPDRIKRRKRLNAFFSWIADQTLRALNEQNYMSYTDCERCEESIRGSQYTSMKLDTSVLSLWLDYGTETAWRCSSHRFGSLVVQPQRRWRLGPRAHSADSQSMSPKGSKTAASSSGSLSPRSRMHESQFEVAAERPEVGSWNFMPPRPVAWFVLLHDLLVLTPEENLLGKPLTPDWNRHEWAGIRWSPPCSDPWRTENTVFVRWPVPHWPSFWQFDSFLCAWNHIVRLAADERDQHERSNIIASLAFWWIRLAVNVFLLKDNRDIFNLESKDFLFDPPKSSPYQTLARDLGSLLQQIQEPTDGECGSNTADEIQVKPTSETPEALADAGRWLVHLALMMLPEYGLTEKVTCWLLNEGSLENLRRLWRQAESVDYIRQVRADNLERFLDEDLEPQLVRQGLVEWKTQKEQRVLLVFAADQRLQEYDWDPRLKDIYLAKKARLDAQGITSDRLEKAFAEKSGAPAADETLSDTGSEASSPLSAGGDA